MAQTCDLVSMVLRNAPEEVFQKRIVRSAVPPPLANKLGRKGHQACDRKQSVKEAVASQAKAG